MHNRVSMNKRIIAFSIAALLSGSLIFGAGTDSVCAAAKLKVTPSKQTIAIGSRLTLKSSKNVRWSVSGQKSRIKIISKSSKSVTVKALKSGTAYVKASKGKETVSSKIVISKKRVPDRINLISTKETVGVGNTCTVYVKSVTPSNASKDVILTSSDESIATVSDIGMVTGVTEGKVTITARSTYDSSKKASVTISVVNSLKGVSTIDFDLTDENKYPKGKTAKLWVPVPSSENNQIVPSSIILWQAPTAAKAELVKDSSGNNVVYIMWDENAEPSERKARITYHSNKTAVICPDNLESREQGGFDSGEMAAYLKETSRTGTLTDGIVKSTADKIVKDSDAETVYQKAKAMYDWVCDNLSIDKESQIVGSENAEYVLNHKDERFIGSADVNNVFVALCRAEGIPARCIYGYRLDVIQNNPKNQNLQSSRTQFYLPGYGWIDLDAGTVLRIVSGHEDNYRGSDAPFADNWKELKERHFGAVSENWITVSQGEDITLPESESSAANDYVMSSSGKLNYSIYPYAEIGGQYVRCYSKSADEPSELDYTYSFEKDPEGCGCD